MVSSIAGGPGSRLFPYPGCRTRAGIRTSFKRWAGGRQRGRPFKDGEQLISAAHAEVRFASREPNQPPPVLLHMRSGPKEGVKGRPLPRLSQPMKAARDVARAQAAGGKRL
jgi:hypothetical protein